MIIKSIKLTNYKGLQNGELSFDDHLTVIVGKNGAGKTSILTAVKTLLSWIIARIESETRKALYIDADDITNGEKHAMIEGDFDITTEPITIPNESKPGIKKRYLLDISGLREYVRAKRADIEASDFKTSVPIFLFYGVKRAVIDVPLRINEHEYSLLDTYKGRLNGAANFRDFFTWFRNQEDIENERKAADPNRQDPADTRELDTFRRALGAFMPEYEDVHVRRKPLRMMVRKGDETLIVNQLSDGEKILFALIGDLCHRLVLANPTLADPLQGEGIVLIDEIDMHLHPQWQGNFAKRLPEVFPNIQFIVTTHSPHVINETPTESLRILQDKRIFHTDYSYGMPSEIVLRDVMGLTHDTPEDIEALTRDIYDNLDTDLEEAKRLTVSLENKVPQHPELTRIHKLIERLDRRQS